VERNQSWEDYRELVMKNQLLERITALGGGQGKAVKKITRPASLKGMFFRVLLLDADERPVESVDFEA
jgi:hypothetical protein